MDNRETIGPDHEEVDHVHRNRDGSTTYIMKDYTGWYFTNDNVGWTRHGPYDAHSVGGMLQIFQNQTGMEGQVGDRVFIKGKLKELVPGRPPKVVASGAAAEDEMERMMRGGR